MPKRGENIYKRKDNRWEGRIKTGVDAKGRPSYKSVYAQSYVDCKTKLKKYEPENILLNSCSSSSSLVFIEACQQWLFNIRPTVKGSSFAVYHYIVERYISGYFQNKKLIEINQGLVDSFVTVLLERGSKNRQKGLSAKTINNILSTLKAVCSFVERQYSIKNPISTLKMIKQEGSNDTVLTWREWEQLSKALSVNQDETAAAVAISLYTGMRIGELCALKKIDIDFDEKVIHVRRTVQRVLNTNGEGGPRTNIMISKPKSAKSLRTIPIPEKLLEKLKWLCSKKKDEAFILGIDGKKALEPRTLQYRFKVFLKNISIRNVNFHTLRHTFATRCIERNVDIKTLSEILGHASVKITLERYVHSSMEFKRMQINRIEDCV